VVNGSGDSTRADVAGGLPATPKASPFPALSALFFALRIYTSSRRVEFPPKPYDLTLTFVSGMAGSATPKVRNDEKEAEVGGGEAGHGFGLSRGGD
jgi:hypothetical protein